MNWRKITTVFLLYYCCGINSLAQNKKLLPSSTCNQVVHHKCYSLSYCNEHKQSEWVCYQLKRSMLKGKQDRADNFREDPQVPGDSSVNKDYKYSGYHKGHLCPAGDMTKKHTYMSESFYMTNISPQVPSFNTGIWKTLENAVRDWVEEEKKIIIVTGGILSSTNGTLGENNITIPKYFYKIIYDPIGKKKLIAFVIPNERSSKELYEYVVSVDHIEHLTGIDFFPEIKDKIENHLESSINPDQWGLKK